MSPPDHDAEPDPAVITPSDPETAAYVARLVERGEAAVRGPDGKLPPGATHEIIGRTPAGDPILRRERFAGLY